MFIQTALKSWVCLPAETQPGTHYNFKYIDTFTYDVGIELMSGNIACKTVQQYGEKAIFKHLYVFSTFLTFYGMIIAISSYL